MKNFQKTSAQIDSLLKKARTECVDFLMEELKKNSDHIECTEFEETVFISYDGGRHPEYASNTASEVESIYLKEGKIYFSIEDSDEYEIDRVPTDELLAVCEILAS